MVQRFGINLTLGIIADILHNATIWVHYAEMPPHNMTLRLRRSNSAQL